MNKKIIWICIVVIFVVFIISYLNRGNSGSNISSHITDNTVSNANNSTQQTFEEKNIGGDQAKFLAVNFNDLPLPNYSGLIVATGTIASKIEVNNIGAESDHVVKIVTNTGNEIFGTFGAEETNSDFNAIDTDAQYKIWGVSQSWNFDCTSTTDANSQKICTALNFKAGSIPEIVILEVDKIQTTNTQTNQTQNSQTDQITVGTPKPAPASKPSIGILYTTAVAGLNKYFDIQSFSSYGNTGYQGKSPVAADITFILADDGINLSTATLVLSDPSVGYDPALTSFPSDWSQERATDNQIINLFMSNVLPNWASAEAWIGNSLQSCVSDGNTVTTNIGSIQVSLSCAKTLGIYTIGIGKIK